MILPRLTKPSRRHLAHTAHTATRRGFRAYQAASRPSPTERRRALAPVRRLRRLLREVQAGAEVYQQAPEDTTRGWCGNLSTYLRGNVAALTLVEPATWDAIERATGKKSTRYAP